MTRTRLHIHCSLTEEAYRILDKKKNSPHFQVGKFISECIITQARDEEEFFLQKAKYHASKMSYWREQLEIVREEKKAAKEKKIILPEVEAFVEG